MTRQTGKATWRRITSDLIECLRQASVETPPWHLSPIARWQLLRDTLLGNSPIRGGVRPRDMPLDAHGIRAQDTALAIQQLRPYKSDGKSILFSRWLAFFCLLQQDSDSKPLVRLCDCVVELRKALGMRGDSLDCPFVHGLLGVLGLSRQEWERGIASPDRDGEHVSLARWAALTTAVSPGAPPQRADLAARTRWRAGLISKMRGLDSRARASRRVQTEGEQHLARLDAIERRLVTIKTTQVQSYIDRAVGHWPMRGASAWCAQSLALERDLLIDVCEDTLLFTDGDALVSLWVVPDNSAANIHRNLGVAQRAFWKSDSGARITAARRFPRLVAWITDARANGVDVGAVGPETSVKADKVFSLLDICILEPAKEQPKRKTTRPAKPLALHRDECAQVRGDRAVFASSPDWHDEERHSGRTGLTSVVWSLCGTTFRTHAFEGLRNALSRHDLQMPPVGQQHLLNMLDMKNEPLVHLKIDGDGVGDVFRRNRYADFPRLSLELAHVMRSRLVAAVGRAMVEHSRLKPNRSCATIPIDLVYLGGDELYCCLPGPLVEAFLDGFGSKRVASGPWSETRYTFVALSLPPKREMEAETATYDVVSERRRRINLAASTILNPGLKATKKAGKAIARGETPPSPATLAEGLKVLAAPYQVVLTCRDVDECHGSLHGARLQLMLAEQAAKVGV